MYLRSGSPQTAKVEKGGRGDGTVKRLRLWLSEKVFNAYLWWERRGQKPSCWSRLKAMFEPVTLTREEREQELLNQYGYQAVPKRKKVKAKRGKTKR